MAIQTNIIGAFDWTPTTIFDEIDTKTKVSVVLLVEVMDDLGILGPRVMLSDDVVNPSGTPFFFIEVQWAKSDQGSWWLSDGELLWPVKRVGIGSNPHNDDLPSVGGYIFEVLSGRKSVMMSGKFEIIKQAIRDYADG